jgi:hypothetical protein
MAGRLVQRLRQLLLLDILLKAYLGAGRMSDGGNALVAVQYGSNIVAAKWLDLTQKISADKCFALEMAEGHLDLGSARAVRLPSARNQNGASV